MFHSTFQGIGRIILNFSPIEEGLIQAAGPRFCRRLSSETKEEQYRGTSEEEDIINTRKTVKDHSMHQY